MSENRFDSFKREEMEKAESKQDLSAFLEQLNAFEAKYGKKTTCEIMAAICDTEIKNREESE